LKDGAADQFGDLWDYGVSEGGDKGPHHSDGNPINHSSHLGFSNPRKAFLPCDCRPDQREAVGVGNIWTYLSKLTDLFVEKFSASVEVQRRMI
jgi:hypothetical protein